MPEPDFEGLDKIREGKTYQAAYNLLLEMIRVIVRAEEENKQEKLQILDQMYGLLAYLINRIEKESKGSGTKVTKVLSSPKIKSYNSHH